MKNDHLKRALDVFGVFLAIGLLANIENLRDLGFALVFSLYLAWLITRNPSHWRAE